MGSATKQASVPQAASACVIPPTAATTIFHRRARAASARRRASAAGPERDAAREAFRRASDLDGKDLTTRWGRGSPARGSRR